MVYLKGNPGTPVQSQFYGDLGSTWLKDMQVAVYIWMFKNAFNKIP